MEESNRLITEFMVDMEFKTIEELDKYFEVHIDRSRKAGYRCGRFTEAHLHPIGTTPKMHHKIWKPSNHIMKKYISDKELIKYANKYYGKDRARQ